MVGDSADRLEIVSADLSADDGWAEAVAGCTHVLHVASPFPAAQPSNPDEVIIPARDGALRILRAARNAGVQRVVLTSSFAAVGYSRKAGSEYDETDWTDPADENSPYVKSKAIAERAASRRHLRSEGPATPSKSAWDKGCRRYSSRVRWRARYFSRWP